MRAHAAFVLLVLPLLARPLSAQEVRGLILEAGTDRPIAAATVTLVTEDGRQVAAGESDGAGRFALTAPRPGRYRVRAARLDYGTGLSEPVDVGRDGESEPVVLRLVARPVPLDPVGVTVDRNREFLEDVGFYRRRRAGLGHFITRDEIEARNAFRFTDLLRMVPGVQVMRGGVVMRGGNSFGFLGACRPSYYVNENRLVEIPDIPPWHIAGIEIYRGASETPVRYRANRCGAIVIWLRR